MYTLTLVKNNDQRIDLWSNSINGDFEIECLADCIKSTHDMMIEIERNHGTESLRLEIDGKEINSEALSDVESLKEYLFGGEEWKKS